MNPQSAAVCKLQLQCDCHRANVCMLEAAPVMQGSQNLGKRVAPRQLLLGSQSRAAMAEGQAGPAW